ncbi:MAG: hypothetical protein RLZZ399_840 [Verrucomicrobiota bacterium]
MFAQFPLREEGHLAAKHVFDGVFEGDDPDGAGLVDVIGEGGDGGGFAAAGVSGEEHQSLSQAADVLPDFGFREADEVDGRDFAGERADDCGDAVAIPKDVEAEGHFFFRPDPGGIDVGEGVGVEALEVFFAKEGGDEGFDHLLSEGEAAFDGAQVAVVAEGGWFPDFEVEIGVAWEAAGLLLRIHKRSKQIHDAEQVP